MQETSPVLPSQTLDCLNDVVGCRRQAEVLGCVEDTIHKQGKPFNKHPGGNPPLIRQPSQVGGAGTNELQK